MLEAKWRSGPARMVKWSAGQDRTETPNVIFHEGPVARPESSDLIYSSSSGGINARISSGHQLFSLPDTYYPPLSWLRHDEQSGYSVGDNALVYRGDARFGPPPNKVHEVAVLGNAFELRRDARQFAKTMVALRRAAGQRRQIFAPGMMDVSNLALLVYMGVDLMDDSLLGMLASQGLISTADGNMPASDAEWLLKDATTTSITAYNREQAWKELQLVRHMIKKDRLREFVELRVHSSAWMVSALRIFDEEFYDFQEERWAVVGPQFFANAKQSLFRPDVWRWRKRILERYTRPETKKILLLIPCSAKKPYYTSKTHQAFRRTIQSVSNFDVVHEVIVTSPLGVVPRELELFYPASQYDIPVTGHWDREEVAMVQEQVRHIASQGYDKIICHLGGEEEFIGLDDFIDTAHGSPTSGRSLNELRSVLEEACAQYPRVPMGLDRQRTMAAVSRFQFGPEAGVLVEGTKVTGSYPYSRMQVGNLQMGMLTPERGMISLTAEGAERIVGKGLGTVTIGDFEVEGNLFAKGVQSADPSIRTGDEVAIMRAGKVAGVGVAMMPAVEMVDSDRGEAVRMRHYRKMKTVSESGQTTG
ncbi:MAG: Archaeosine synthase [Methanomassiliicoccales archaeon PtaU1.Bin124]|nr:MAG: Archaeosine synthase [Methanomassiliicoccales archaeon PtaU1.Bin124]